jgi:hypothetical protein
VPRAKAATKEKKVKTVLLALRVLPVPKETLVPRERLALKVPLVLKELLVLKEI